MIKFVMITFASCGQIGLGTRQDKKRKRGKTLIHSHTPFMVFRVIDAIGERQTRRLEV